MNQMRILKATTSLLLSAGVLGLVASGYSAPNTFAIQKNRGGGQRGGAGGGAAPVHARREAVRTQNYVGRTSTGFQPQPPVRQATPRRSPPTNFTPTRTPRQPVVRRSGGVSRVIQDQRTFTKTTQGRQYDNGLVLRKGIRVTETWQRHYFPHGYIHFPYYRPTFIAGQCFISPFGFYFGVCAPFIDISACSVFPPATVFVDVPVYNGNDCIGYPGLADANMINDPNLDQERPGLNNALDELYETFQGGDIDGIVSLINPNMRIAIFERGQYQYSMSANDFTDMTRDAIQSTKTVEYSLDYLHQRSADVFCVSGHNVYTDPNGRQRTVYVSYVLQDISGLWTLTQVETSPDIVQNF